MKIETDISKKFFSFFYEARGIALHKKKILKNKKISVFIFFFYKKLSIKSSKNFSEVLKDMILLPYGT